MDQGGEGHGENLIAFRSSAEQVSEGGQQIQLAIALDRHEAHRELDHQPDDYTTGTDEQSKIV